MESVSNAFEVEVDSAKLVCGLEKFTRAKKPIAFSDIDADQLNLWRISIPDDKRSSATTIGALDNKTERPSTRA
ncbi:hypothetical protein BGZ81_011428 [Podila clonocystis]|nr:hypothetical protein BGZ81_011428 [Podila clonocystis]